MSSQINNAILPQPRMITVQIPTISMESAELEALLERAAERGAQQAIDRITCFNYKEACERLSISYTTLQKYLKAGKIRAVDGRIAASEITRHLTQKRRN